MSIEHQSLNIHNGIFNVISSRMSFYCFVICISFNQSSNCHFLTFWNSLITEASAFVLSRFRFKRTQTNYNFFSSFCYSNIHWDDMITGVSYLCFVISNTGHRLETETNHTFNFCFFFHFPLQLVVTKPLSICQKCVNQKIVFIFSFLRNIGLLSVSINFILKFAFILNRHLATISLTTWKYKNWIGIG